MSPWHHYLAKAVYEDVALISIELPARWRFVGQAAVPQISDLSARADSALTRPLLLALALERLKRRFTVSGRVAANT